MQRDPLGSSEFLCDFVKGATFSLGQTEPGEGEGRQSCSHEEQVHVRAADLLWGKSTETRSEAFLLRWRLRHDGTLKPTSNGGKSSARTNFPPQLSMLVKAMAIGLPGWSNSSAAMNQEMGPGPSS